MLKVPAENVSVQHNDGFLPGIILLTQCYYRRGTRLNAMEMFCICSLRSHLLNVLTFSPLTGGCSEGLDALSFFFKHTHTHTHQRTQLTIVTNIVKREFVATALILSFHFLRWVFYAPRHHETEGVKFE